MKKTFLTILLSAALAMGATAQNSKEFKTQWQMLWLATWKPNAMWAPAI